MDLREALDKAEKKVDGLRALSRLIDWDAANLAHVKAGRRPLPPMRAAQIAALLGYCKVEAVLRAHADAAEGRGDEGEREFWAGLIREHRATCPHHRG